MSLGEVVVQEAACRVMDGDVGGGSLDLGINSGRAHVGVVRHRQGAVADGADWLEADSIL